MVLVLWFSKGDVISNETAIEIMSRSRNFKSGETYDLEERPKCPTENISCTKNYFPTIGRGRVTFSTTHYYG